MKSKGLYYELQKNYLRKLSSDRTEHIFREERVSALTGMPQIQTPYSNMPQSLRISTMSGLEPEEESHVVSTFGAHMARGVIQPIEDKDKGLINPVKISSKFKGLMQMIRDKIIDPIDEVLEKVHDFIMSIPAKLYDAELKLREIFPLVLKGIIPTAVMLLVFVNKAYGADGTAGDDAGYINQIGNLINDALEFASNHWMAMALFAGNIWAAASLILGKLQDYKLGSAGRFFTNFGRHIIFPLSMLGNMMVLSKALH